MVEKQIQINRILTLNSNQARAIEDTARAAIIKILYKKALSAEQIRNKLHKSGHKKALTTIRHHLEILKKTGLIEIVRMEETRAQ